MFILAWVLTLHFVHDTPCWANYSQLPYYYIITVPFILALAVSVFRLDGWLVVLGLTALLDSISVYIGPSPKEREKEKRKDR